MCSERQCGQMKQGLDDNTGMSAFTLGNTHAFQNNTSQVCVRGYGSLEEGKIASGLGRG